MRKAHLVEAGVPDSRRFFYLLKRFDRSKYLYLLLILPLLYFVVFKYGAMLWLTIAFKKFNVSQGLWGSEWVGFKYFSMFVSDPYFWKLIRNTLLLNVYGLIFNFPVPIALALLINTVKNRRYRKFVQSVSYLPYFVSTVVVSGLIVSYLASDGIINQVVQVFVGRTIPFLAEPQYFRVIYVLSEIWQHAGWTAIIYLAALAGISPELYESAKMDGASQWKQMIHISLPGIAPVIAIQFLLTVGQLLSVGYEKILLLYNGATYETADVISTYIYRRAIYSAEYSYGAAVSMFQAVLTLILVIVANRAAKRMGSVSLW